MVVAKIPGGWFNIFKYVWVSLLASSLLCIFFFFFNQAIRTKDFIYFWQRVWVFLLTNYLRSMYASIHIYIKVSPFPVDKGKPYIHPSYFWLPYFYTSFCFNKSQRSKAYSVLLLVKKKKTQTQTRKQKKKTKTNPVWILCGGFAANCSSVFIFFIHALQVTC